jgi:hypothetical protein
MLQKHSLSGIQLAIMICLVIAYSQSSPFKVTR